MGAGLYDGTEPKMTMKDLETPQEDYTEDTVAQTKELEVEEFQVSSQKQYIQMAGHRVVAYKERRYDSPKADIRQSDELSNEAEQEKLR